MSEPARPNREAEKDRPMPWSGPERAFFNSSNSTAASWPVRRDAMIRPTDPTVSIRPQNVPRRPRNTRRPAR